MKQISQAFFMLLISAAVFSSCAKKQSTNSVNPTNPTNPTPNNNEDSSNNKNGELIADFELKAYQDVTTSRANYSVSSGGYLDHILVESQNKSKGAIVSYKWYGRVGSYSSSSGGNLMGENMNFSKDFDLEDYHDSTFIDVTLEVADKDGNKATKRKTLALKMHRATGKLIIGNKQYDLYADDLYSKDWSGLNYYNREDLSGNCYIYIGDKNFSSLGPLRGLKIEIHTGGTPPIITVPSVTCTINYNGYTNEDPFELCAMVNGTGSSVSARKDVLGGEIKIQTNLINSQGDVIPFYLEVYDLPHQHLKYGPTSSDCLFK